MKRARFTEEQIIGVLKEHEAGAKTADRARKYGAVRGDDLHWKAKFGAMDVSEAKRRADARCGRPSRASFKQMVGPAAKRAAIAHLQAVMSLSERRACSIVGADRKMIRYGSSRPPETALRGRLRDLANVLNHLSFHSVISSPSTANYAFYRYQSLVDPSLMIVVAKDVVPPFRFKAGGWELLQSSFEVGSTLKARIAEKGFFLFRLNAETGPVESS